MTSVRSPSPSKDSTAIVMDKLKYLFCCFNLCCDDEKDDDQLQYPRKITPAATPERITPKYDYGSLAVSAGFGSHMGRIPDAQIAEEQANKEARRAKKEADKIAREIVKETPVSEPEGFVLDVLGYFRN